MSKLRRKLPIITAVSTILVLILDSTTAAQGAADAVQLCIRTAIPSLFPFFVLSGYLVPHISQLRISGFGKLLRIPTGWESIFLLGCLGGYPIGAQCVAQSYASGKLDKQQAQRMLGFCTNCGPSFLFGVVGCSFSDPLAPLVISAISIGSAILVGILWPAQHCEFSKTPNIPAISLTQAVQQALRSMASVCAWIILGKVLLSFLQKWVLWHLPLETVIFLTGLLELTNGCLNLNLCADDGLRFLIACTITSFGGLCVAMQAAAICQISALDNRSYLPQKVLQAGIAAILAVVYLSIPGSTLHRLGLFAGLFILVLILCKKAVEIPQMVVYNKSSKGGI